MTGNLLFFPQSNVAAHERGAEAVGELVVRARGGEQEAFNQLYRKFAPLVHGILLARVRRDEVDDLVQEVFLAAYSNLSGLKNPHSFGAWLGTTARNRATEFYRRERLTEELTDALPDKNQARSEAAEILQTIRALPETYRETLILRLVEGLSGKEIAEQTGLTPESVRVNLHRGMKMLREKLGIEQK